MEKAKLCCKNSNYDFLEHFVGVDKVLEVRNNAKMKIVIINYLDMLSHKMVTVGNKVRKAIADIGGTMPEDMPTLDKGLKILEREKKQLANKEQKKLEGIK